MDWVKHHYTEQSRLVGRALVRPQHRRIAAGLDRWCRALPRCQRVLELGAGACGVAAALVELGHEVHAVELNPADVDLARRLKAE